MSYRTGDERVFFQIHGLPQVYKLKISLDSPLQFLFDHVPADKYTPPLCVTGPEFLWNDKVLDPNLTPEDYGMEWGDRNVQSIKIHFPLVSPRRLASLRANERAAAAPSSRDDAPSSARHSAAEGGSAVAATGETPRRATPRQQQPHQQQRPLSPTASATPRNGGAPASSAALSSHPSTSAPPSLAPLPPPAAAPAPAAPAAPSVDKIIDDLTQALRAAEDEIEELQAQLAHRDDALQFAPEKQRVQQLEDENRILRTELEQERRANDSKQEAIGILRNKLTALEHATNITATPREPSVSARGDPAALAAAEALANSLRHHCHALEEEVANREDEIRTLNARLDESRQETAQAKQEQDDANKKMREAFEKMEAQRVTAMQRNDQVERSTEDSAMRIERLERENAMLQSDNQALAQRVVAAETYKAELRTLKNDREIDDASWNAQKIAYEKEIKSLREKSAEQQLAAHRHEKALADRNAALQEKIAFFEDPRSVSQREEEMKFREIELRGKLRDTLAENERLKTLHKDQKRQVAELETALFECNNVLVRVQKENTDMKRVNSSSSLKSPIGASDPRLPSHLKRESLFASLGATSPAPSAPQGSHAATQAVLANSRQAENDLLHVDPFALAKMSSVERSNSMSSPNVADALLLSRHTSTLGAVKPLAGGQDVRSSGASTPVQRAAVAATTTSERGGTPSFQDV